MVVAGPPSMGFATPGDEPGSGEDRARCGRDCHGSPARLCRLLEPAGRRFDAFVGTPLDDSGRRDRHDRGTTGPLIGIRRIPGRGGDRPAPGRRSGRCGAVVPPHHPRPGRARSPIRRPCRGGVTADTLGSRPLVPTSTAWPRGLPSTRDQHVRCTRAKGRHPPPRRRPRHRLICTDPGIRPPSGSGPSETAATRDHRTAGWRARSSCAPIDVPPEPMWRSISSWVGATRWPGSAFSQSISSVTGHTTLEIDATRRIWAFSERFRL